MFTCIYLVYYGITRQVVKMIHTEQMLFIGRLLIEIHTILYKLYDDITE